MSRFTDIIARPRVATGLPPLPAINWGLVGQAAPIPITISNHRPEAKLPKADIAVLTWTEEEWSAFDNVFLHSSTSLNSTSSAFKSKWLLYSRGAPAGSSDNKLWGYFQLVKIQGQGGASFDVLLFKSDTHLAHPPWIAGLTNMVDAILADAQPQRIYSIGTAGGANGGQNLGDVPLTNAARLQATLHDNTGVTYNNQTVTCTSWFPDTTTLLPAVQAKLFYPLSQVATRTELQQVLQDAQNSKEGKSLKPFTLDDLLNSALEPANLSSPKALVLKDTPLLTTDTYYIAPSNTPYAALEMDDAVVAHTAQQQGIAFAFVRNISDTLVPSTTPSGVAIGDQARQAWSSAVYDRFGIYTSLNGALAAWATIAGAKS
jgi:nucleoside phosphorylase